MKEATESQTKPTSKFDQICANVKSLVEDTESEDPFSCFFMDQLTNRFKQKSGYRWSQSTIKRCLIINARSPGTYDYIRRSKMIILPSVVTLRSYIGTSTGSIGVTEFVIKRLQMEASVRSPMERFVTLGLDECAVKERLVKLKNNDVYVGDVNMGGIVPEDKQKARQTNLENDDEGEEDDGDPNMGGLVPCKDEKLANKMLAFCIRGLSTYMTFPVGYFFVKKLKAHQLRLLTLHVMAKVEEHGFKVTRLVADNAATNTSMFSMLGGGGIYKIQL